MRGVGVSVGGRARVLLQVGARALIAALVVFAAAAAGASAVLVKASNGHHYGIYLRRGVRASSLPRGLSVQRAASTSTSSSASTPGRLSYHGGPVLQSSAPYLIFWDPSGTAISSTSRGLLTRYLTDVATDSGKTSDVYAVDWQYTDSLGDSAGKAITFSSATQVINDSQPFPPVDSSICSSNCVTDAQLIAEISRLRAADGLPGGTGAGAPIYFIVTPENENVCVIAGSCASTTFCAYHSNFADGSSTVLYSSIPLAPLGNDLSACQDAPYQEPNGVAEDVTISNLSHEANETITDPVVNPGQTSWWNSTTGNEIGDECFTQFAPALGGSALYQTLYNQLINGDQYYTQSEWSNSQGACRLRVLPDYPVVATGSQTYGSSSPSFTTSTSPPSGEGFSGTLTCTTVNGGSAIGPTLTVGGSFTIDGSSCFGLTLPDYDVSSTGSTFTVNQAPLTVNAPSASAYYGAVPTSFTPTYTGFVNGDTSASLTAAPTCTTTATNTSPPGTYPINCSGASDSNYLISYAAGVLTIAKAPTNLVASGVFSATLSRVDSGARLAGKTIVFSVKGKTVCQATTNSSGVGRCTPAAGSVRSPGTYIASFAGDIDYLATSTIGNF